jgi:integrase
VGYRTLYDSMRSWVRRAIVSSSLPPVERDVALRASLHWLRHTCGTRALERDMQLPELQAQFGHTDPRTTMRYSKVQLRRRQAAVSKAFA